VSKKFNLDKVRLLKGLETDPETLRKRQKRINYGKVTAEYKRYLTELPKFVAKKLKLVKNFLKIPNTRKKRETFHPRTPNKYRKCSRRKFDGLIKKWRKLLHVWDENPDMLPDYKYLIEI
jgi:histone RNA hairpin-binding protein